jgi:multidrug efflux pump subunit AcrA (membrane-fusion protein)
MSFQGGQIFRERAVRPGDVRQELDEHLDVVRPPRWIALAIGLLIVAGLIAWAASSSVQTTVPGDGALNYPANIDVVRSPGAGRVTVAPPPAGSVVRAGQRLAEIQTSSGTRVDVQTLVSGTVTAVFAQTGQVVVPGRVLANVRPLYAKGVLVSYLFVKLDDVRSIQPGMKAELAPAGLDTQEESLLVGHVRRVNRYPATAQRIAQVAGTGVANQLASGPVRAEVDVQLVQDPSTPTGYEWTTGKGPAEPLAAGTVITGKVITARKSPLDFAF